MEWLIFLFFFVLCQIAITVNAQKTFWYRCLLDLKSTDRVVGSKMYWEWATLTGSIGNGSDKFERSSVLTSLPPESAKEVVGAVVRHVVSTLGISQPPSPSSFDSDVEVEWCLQVS